MHPNAELIQKFYSSFQKKDPAAMNACYHDQAEFWDPVFQNLPAWKARAMWSMLCERAQDLEITFRNVEADDVKGRAHWDASYTFGKTGRKVNNSIDALFDFKDGKIVKHKDSFDLWKWAGMALGPSGLFLGWLPSVQGKIRKESQTALEMYVKRKRLGPPA